MPIPVIAASSNLRHARRAGTTARRRAPRVPRYWAVWRIVVLIGFWVALWGTITPATTLSGLALAVLLTGGVRRSQPATARWRMHPLAMIRATAPMARGIVADNLAMARAVLRGGSRAQESVVAVPLQVVGADQDALVALAVTVTPGTIAVDVRRRTNETSVLLVHAVDATAAEVRAAVHGRERLITASASVERSR